MRRTSECHPERRAVLGKRPAGEGHPVISSVSLRLNIEEADPMAIGHQATHHLQRRRGIAHLRLEAVGQKDGAEILAAVREIQQDKGLFGKRAQRHACALRERMRGGQQRIGLVRREMLGDQFGSEGEIVDQGELDAAGRQSALERLDVALVKLQNDVGMERADVRKSDDVFM